MGETEIGKSKIHWVDWQKMTSPKTVGGLGIGSLKAANTALLVKWWWRLKVDNQALWATVITTIHGVTERDSSSLANTSLVKYRQSWYVSFIFQS